MDPLTEDLVEFCRVFFPSVPFTPPIRANSANQGVCLHSHHIRHLHEPQPGKPFAIDKLPIHREGENQRPDGARRQHAIGKEPLEPPLKRLRFGRGCRVTGEPDQRDGALAENRKDQHQKAGHACLGELQMRFEEFAESLHRRFVGLGMVVFFVRKQWLTPQAAIC